MFSAVMTESLATDPLQITELRAAATIDPVAGPLLGLLVTTDGPFSVDRMAMALDYAADPKQPSTYLVDRRGNVILSKVDDARWYFGNRQLLSTLTDSPIGRSAAADVMNGWPADNQLRIVLDVPTLRPLLAEPIEAGRQALVAPLQPILDLPSLTETLQIRAAFDGTRGELQWRFDTANEASARRIETILNDTLAAAVQLLSPQIFAALNLDSAPKTIQQPARDYADRTSAWILDNLKVVRVGSAVTLDVQGDVGIASTIAVAGYAMPQIAREIARIKFSKTNNLKQIMLGIHNYHSAFNRLPGPGITDDDGKLLLSWRVALLPFIGEQRLWEQFRKHEPWDSEHNLPLANQMPAVYQARRLGLKDNQTVYHALVGEGLAISPDGENTFRQILDGLSNTLMVIESKPEHAVIWSKPEDMAIDMKDPMAGLPEGPDGFGAALGDGAVRVLTRDMDVELFRRLLTRAGMEVIDRNALR